MKINMIDLTEYHKIDLIIIYSAIIAVCCLCPVVLSDVPPSLVLQLVLHFDVIVTLYRLRPLVHHLNITEEM